MLEQLKYFRIYVFSRLLAPFSRHFRKKRMQMFVKIIQPTAGMRVLDMGGQPAIWDHVTPSLRVTCLNLPGIINKDHVTHHQIRYVEGDACSMPYFKRGDFDIVFSNSVIEHVGGLEKQQAFAAEIQRLSDNYWVQTPCKHFPIEAHCGMPFWWYYPNALRSYFLKRWSKKLPAWAEMVDGTTVITKQDLKSFFPDSSIITEWMFFPKSLIAYSSKPNRPESSVDDLQDRHDAGR